MMLINSKLQSKWLILATVFALIGITLAPAPAQAANFTVTYSTSGSTSGSAPGTATVAEATSYATASSTTLAKSGGFTFYGWSTAANAGGTVYAAGASFTMPAAAVTLYPVWTGTLNYSSNYGTGSASSTTQTYYFGQSVTLPTVGTMARSSYLFAGWSTATSGGTYSSGGSSYSTTGLTASPTTLYATWYRTYSFDGNGATVGVVPAAKEWFDATTGADLSSLGTDLKRRGYDFAGWSTGAGYAPITSLFVPSTTGQVLYAAWNAQPIKRTLAFNFAAKKVSLTPTAKALLAELAKTFDKNALFPKKNIQVFVGSTRHSSTSASLGTNRINAVTKYLKSLGVEAKFFWSNDVRKTGNASYSENNRIRIISTWVN